MNKLKEFLNFYLNRLTIFIKTNQSFDKVKGRLNSRQKYQYFRIFKKCESLNCVTYSVRLRARPDFNYLDMTLDDFGERSSIKVVLELPLLIKLLFWMTFLLSLILPILFYLREVDLSSTNAVDFIFSVFIIIFASTVFVMSIGWFYIRAIFSFLEDLKCFLKEIEH